MRERDNDKTEMFFPLVNDSDDLRNAVDKDDSRTLPDA
jgi:hypothetical protein